MKNIDVEKIFNLLKEINIAELKYENEDIYNEIYNILSFIGNIQTDFLDNINELIKSNVRFCDYYDDSLIHGEDIKNYFMHNYIGIDKELQTNCFLLYALFKKIENIIYTIELFENNIDDLYNTLNEDYYFDDINYLINEICKIKENKNLYDELPFMHADKKYKIMFSGYSYDDILKLEKQIIKALINKLSSQLSSSDIITLSESIDHVKDRFGMPICRIQLADDYRICYYRKDGVTVILGVTLKTGKPIDYTRYDYIASKQDILDKEIMQFNADVLEPEAIHYKTIAFLDEFYKKNMKKNNISKD